MAEPKQACWDRTEGCCMTDVFERGMRRAARIQVRKRRPEDQPSVMGNDWRVTCSGDDCPGVVWLSNHQAAIQYAGETAAVHMPKHHAKGATP